jgi:hypothetical protein
MSRTLNRTPLKLPEVPMTADLMVVILVVACLLGAWAIRGQQLSASETGSTPGVTFSVPAGSLTVPAETGYAATTPAGLSVQVRELPLPVVPAASGDSPTGNVTGTLTLVAANWALNQASQTNLFRVLENQSLTVAGQEAIVQEYVYVDADNTSLYSNALQVIQGYGLITIQSGKAYLITLDAPEDAFEEVQAFWPRLLDSLRFG